MPHSNNHSPVKLPDVHTVDIWQVPLDTYPLDTTSLHAILDTHELNRHKKLHKKLQLSYLLSHAACREILARYLKIPAEQVKYKKNPHGKPFLDLETSICFNMSHSETLALVAVSNHAQVGVDVEFTEKSTTWEKISKRFFNPAEIQYLFAQNSVDQKKTFFQIWTRKEAYIKAIGTGFATSLSSFNVITPCISTERNPENNDTIWHQEDLTIHPQYTGAVVLNTPIEKIRYYSY